MRPPNHSPSWRLTTLDRLEYEPSSRVKAVEAFTDIDQLGLEVMQGSLIAPVKDG